MDLNGGVKLWRDADKLNLDGDIDILIVVVAIFKHMSHAMMGGFGTIKNCTVNCSILVVNRAC